MVYRATSSLQFPHIHFSNFSVIISDVNIRALDFSRHLLYHLHRSSYTRSSFSENLCSLSVRRFAVIHIHPFIQSGTLHRWALARSLDSIHSIHFCFVFRLLTSSFVRSFFSSDFLLRTQVIRHSRMITWAQRNRLRKCQGDGDRSECIWWNIISMIVLLHWNVNVNQFSLHLNHHLLCRMEHALCSECKSDR